MSGSQLTFEEQFSRTHARNEDLDTSKAAAALASIKVTSIKGRILRYLESVRPRAMGFEEIARGTGLTEGQVWKRLSDLKNDELIRASGETTTNRSGAKATRWRLANVPKQGVLL